ncbi:hypothetical protein J4Q44_G00009070 [Coregonus suidteri]|uniref:FERM domain-containing protein n=1 Tax=Coregonus suidteri TaxID=861788 RepID=A0AAN8MDI5_9TELE
MSLPTLKEELPQFHANNAQMLPKQAKTEYLKIAQQLPEYGMVFHRVGREKKPMMRTLRRTSLSVGRVTPIRSLVHVPRSS